MHIYNKILLLSTYYSLYSLQGSVGDNSSFLKKAQVKTKEEAKAWIKNELPYIIRREIGDRKCIHNCSGVSAIISQLAERAGFDSYVLDSLGHVVAYIFVNEGAFMIDATYLQKDFQHHGGLKDFSRDEVGGEEYNRMKKLFDNILKDPLKHIIIEFEENPPSRDTLQKENFSLEENINYLEEYKELIPIDNIFIEPRGLRQESFDYLEPFFKKSGGEYPTELKPVSIISYPDKKELHVQDGRHRLLLSKKYGIKQIPAIHITMDEEGFTEEQSVIIENIKQKFI